MLDLASLHFVLRCIHIAAGTIGLIAFWAAIFTKKGTTAHIRCGRAFVICAYQVGITSVLSSGWAIIDPYGFGRSIGLLDEDIRRLSPERGWIFSVLGLAGLSLLAYVQVGVYAVKTKNQPRRSGQAILLATLLTFGLAGAGLAARGIMSLRDIGPAIQNTMPLVLGTIALPLVYTMWTFVRRLQPNDMDWWCKHMECMLVSGIIFHTALAITISTRLMRQGLLTGPAELIPWILPTLIGVPVTFVWILRYKLTFGRCRREQTKMELISSNPDVKHLD